MSRTVSFSILACVLLAEPTRPAIANAATLDASVTSQRPGAPCVQRVHESRRGPVAGRVTDYP